MNKEKIKRKYNKLVNDIENRLMYDGRKVIDRYKCNQCGAIVYTTYKDKGVTPFTMRCKCCYGTMMHDKTYDKTSFPPHIVVKKWYRPSLKETIKMSHGMIEHILNGGLILEE